MTLALMTSRSAISSSSKQRQSANPSLRASNYGTRFAHGCRLAARHKFQRVTAVRLVVRAQADSGDGASSKASSVLLWYKHDLRVADHPGIAMAQEAVSGGTVVPIYVFDPEEASSRSAPALEYTLESVAGLRAALRGLGSDLVVRVGDPGSVLAEVAQQAAARTVVAEEELGPVRAPPFTRAKSALQKTGIETVEWHISVQAPAEEGKQALPLRQPPSPEYDYTAEVGTTWGAPHPAPPLQPLPAPAALPALLPGLDAGALPSLDQVVAMAGKQAPAAKELTEGDLAVIAQRRLDRAQKAAIAARGMGDIQVQAEAAEELAKWRGAVAARDWSVLSEEDLNPWRMPGGEQAAQHFLTGYVQFHETMRMRATEPAWVPMHDDMADNEDRTEFTQGDSFSRFFSPAITNGCLSLRSMAAEAIAYEGDIANRRHAMWYYDEKKHCFGFPSVKAVVDMVARMDGLMTYNRTQDFPPEGKPAAATPAPSQPALVEDKEPAKQGMFGAFLKKLSG